VASRTDRGVSAIGNAMLLDSTLSGGALLRALNGIAAELFFSHAVAVDPSFRVRTAEERAYRYFEIGPGIEARRYRRWAAMLTGRIDVRSFGRRLPDGGPVWRDVTEVRVTPTPGGAIVEVRAPSFVWGMVRKMISALRGLDSGRVSEAEVRSALSGGHRLALPLAEPEPLVLWDVRYPVAWTHISGTYGRHQLRYWAESRKAWASRGPVLGSVGLPPLGEIGVRPGRSA